jgi:outer membrane murein-binding lipoprotein Lpp
MDLQVEQEVSQLRKEIAEIKSELTLALTRIADKLATHSDNYRELKSKIEQLNKDISLMEEQDSAEVQHEHLNRNIALNPAD